MPPLDFREARARLRLAAVLELLGFVPRTRHGDCLRGPCPVHRSRSAASRSFAAHLGKGVWHCFTCGAGGNTLDLWAAVTQQDLHAAVRDVCRRLGCAVPWLPTTQSVPRRVACWEPVAHPEETMPDP